jgi:SAM-dependent methyltransferase
MQDTWNQRFAQPGYKYGIEPNAWLKRQAHRLAPGAQCLVPGDGEGRNGVWLAEQGHEVWSVDFAEAGLAKARALAEERGPAVAARLHTECADLLHWRVPEARFDALVLIFLHFPSVWRTRVYQRLATALQPGGWLLVEGFHPGQLGFGSGGPRDADMLFTPEDLRADFSPLLQEVQAEHAEVFLDEGEGHQGLGHVTRWLGQRL